MMEGYEEERARFEKELRKSDANLELK